MCVLELFGLAGVVEVGKDDCGLDAYLRDRFLRCYYLFGDRCKALLLLYYIPRCERCMKKRAFFLHVLTRGSIGYAILLETRTTLP